MTPERHCPKCNRWSNEKGSGKGRQYRCDICAAGRLQALLKKRQQPERRPA